MSMDRSPLPKPDKMFASLANSQKNSRLDLCKHTIYSVQAFLHIQLVLVYESKKYFAKLLAMVVAKQEFSVRII